MSIAHSREDEIQPIAAEKWDRTDRRELTRKRNPLWNVSFIAAASFLLTWGCLQLLGFQFMQSDVYGYWKDSLAWRTPFNPDHVPGYPLLIASLRFLTAGKVDPILLFLGVTFLAHIAGALAVFTAVVSRASERIGYVSVLLFVMWPFVGSTYVAFPVSDSVAMALLAWGAALLLQERNSFGAIPLGFAAIIHKGTWIFILFLMAASIIEQRRRFKWTALLYAGLPLGLLWLAGMVWNSYRPDWLLSVSLPIQFATKSSLPVLDGILGTALAGGTKNLLKTFVLWSHVGLLLALLVALIRKKSSASKWFGLAIVCGLLFLYGGLNQNIIWAAVRYSKFAALAVGLYFGIQPKIADFFFGRTWKIAVLAGLLLASQFAFSLYMARYYFAVR